MKGQEIYYQSVQKQSFNNYEDSIDNQINYYEDLSECEKFYYTYYLLTKSLVRNEKYSIKLLYSVVGYMQAKTSIYRGDYGFAGVEYARKEDIYLDLKDWKKKLNCE